jgi:hypothetical protein
MITIGKTLKVADITQSDKILNLSGTIKCSTQTRHSLEAELKRLEQADKKIYWFGPVDNREHITQREAIKSILKMM